MIEVNYLAILISSIGAMIVGAVWYGPLFGKKWLQIVGATELDIEARKEMQKGATKLYIVQFLITLFQVWVLYIYIVTASDQISALSNSLWIWAGFVLPTVAGSAMWNNDSSKISWARFLIQGGYQLVLFVMFALVISAFI